MKTSNFYNVLRETCCFLLAVLISLPVFSCVSVRVPPPPSGLPNPYQGASFEPENSEQQAYFLYLEETPMFPDQKFCEEKLLELLDGDQEQTSAEWVWVTAPFLAWGSLCRNCIEGLFTITEAHVTYPDSSGRMQRATFSCHVQYATFGDEKVWKKGELRYGANLQEGHNQYIEGPAQTPWSAPSGTATTWHDEIFFHESHRR